MKIILSILFSMGIYFQARSQDFKYFIPDTISSRIIYLKLKEGIKFSKPVDNVAWYWRKEREMIKCVEDKAFKEAFRDVSWKQMPALTDVGVFFRFDKTSHVDYIHFIIPLGDFSRDDLLYLEKCFLQYVRLIKKVDLKPYLYSDNPEKFVNGISRFSLIRKTSPLWGEK